MIGPIDGSWWVIPGALLASPFPGNPDPEKADERYRALLRAGIRTFINLQQLDEVGQGGQPFPSYEERIAELAKGMPLKPTFHRMPIPDMAVPSNFDVRVILALVDGALKTDWGVILHCWGGHGRTGTIVGCWLRQQGLGPDEALAEITELRNHDPYLRSQPAPQTAAQIEMVRNWGR